MEELNGQPESPDLYTRIGPARNLTIVIYALYGASFFLGVTAIVGIILNYLKQSDVAGTIYESHFRWQKNTFWGGLVLMMIGFFTLFIVIGWVILIADSVWIIYRLVKGYLKLNDHEPMYKS
jgi:uncharacterized membrane protein